MTRQPYIYTMPEGFMNDPSIGVKWKIYAIVNGFWISGKTCYAANKFFAEKLGVSERQVRNGFAQLEQDGYLERVIRGNSRIALPKGVVVEEEIPLPGGGSQSSAEAEARVPHISDSISDNKNTDSLRSSDSLQKVEEVDEESAGPAKAPKDPSLQKAARYWVRKCENEIGISPSGGLSKTMSIIKSAKKSLNYSEIKEMMDSWFEEQTLEDHEMIQITRCLSSFQIDKFKSQNV